VWRVVGGYDMTREESNFQVEPVGECRGEGMGEMQEEDDGCEEPRAVVMRCCKEIIQGGCVLVNRDVYSTNEEIDRRKEKERMAYACWKPTADML
jgi:hypothetical protein